MKLLIRNIKIVLVIFLALSLALLSGLVVQQYRSKIRFDVAAGENKAALKTRYANAGIIYDRNGSVLAESVGGTRLYADDDLVAKAALHLVGDYTHNIGNTIEARYQGQLLGTDRNFFHQLLLDFTGQGLKGDDVTLTIDGKLSKKAYQLLGGRKGAIVLLNYRTGAILASVSSPSTSPESVIAFKNIPDTALFNRALLGTYAPGSTYKILTAAAWIKSPIYDPKLEVNCLGQSTVNKNGAKEDGGGHGENELDAAFAESCNVFFGQIGARLGAEQMLATADSFGLGRKLTLDQLEIATSKINTLDDPAVLSWLAIGQPTADSILQITPLQLAMIAGAIGNGGVMQQAHVVDHLTNPLGMTYQELRPHALMAVVDSGTAGFLEKLMVGATKTGTGSAAAVKGCTVASKTGTVQVEDKKNTALFVGYITDDEHPYAIAVVVEEGGSGGRTAAPIAGKLLAAAVAAE